MKKNQTKTMSSLKLFGLSIVSGLLLALPFWYYRAGWLVFVSVLPFIYLLWQLEIHKLRIRSQIGFIWLSGWVMMMGVTLWVLQTQPERWTALQGWWATSGLTLSYLILSLALSVGFVIFGLLYCWLRIRLDQKRIFILFPALWVICEWTRSWLFSIISYGPNTTMGPHWNFGDLGFAASATPLVFASRFVGLYGLTFMVVIINLSIWWLLQRRWRLPVLNLALIVIICLSGFLLYRSPQGKQIRVATLQLGINQDLKIGSIEYHDKLKNLAPERTIDVFVLPEYSEIFTDQAGSTKAKDAETISYISSGNNTPVITSRQRKIDNQIYNTVTVYRPDGQVVYEHDKQFLIPVGEAMPYIYIYLFSMLGKKEAVSVDRIGHELTRGKEPAQAYHLDSVNFGSMACSGAISPELYRGLVKQNAQILTNSASLSIFSKAPIYHYQAQQMARFMSVANARSFVQSTDGSISFILDSNGRWLAKSSFNDIDLLQKDVTTNQTKTLYSLFGEWIVLASIVIIVVFLVVKRYIK